MTVTYYYCAFFAMVFMEFQHVMEWEVADYIAVQYEEGFTVFCQVVFGEC